MANKVRRVKAGRYSGEVLSSFSDRIAFCRYVTGHHYELFETDDGLFGWKGLDSEFVEASMFYSQDLFSDVYECTTEALYCLYRFEGYGDEDACQVIYELSLPAPSDELRGFNFDLTPADEVIESAAEHYLF